MADSLWRQLLRLALPAAATSLLETVIFLADRIMLGRYSQQALASMQVQGPVTWSLFSIFMGVCVGGVSVVARSIGAENAEQARAGSLSVMRLSLLAGCIVSLICWVGAPFISESIGPADSELISLSVTYLRWVAPGFPGLFFATAGALMLSASGDTLTPFRIAIFSNVFNLALNQILIFGVSWGGFTLPPLGVMGAAFATSLAFSAQALLTARALLKPNCPVSIQGFWGSGADTKAVTQEVLRLSGPVLIERIIFHSAYIIYASLIARMGTLVMAANQALITLESICFLLAQGFGVATAALVGQSLGKGDIARARKAGWLGANLAALLLTSCGLIIWLTAPWTLQVFVPKGQDAEPFIREGMRAIVWLALAQPFMAYGAVLCDALRGAGATRLPLFVTLSGSVFVRIPLVLWLGLGLSWGTAGVWIATGTDWALRTVFAVLLFIGPLWTRARVRI